MDLNFDDETLAFQAEVRDSSPPMPHRSRRSPTTMRKALRNTVIGTEYCSTRACR
ncbi:Uncharacterised protein [Mycobacterium tuberculosis]|nr:Uncharacterised protein [Mycobacterium tuberculosis]